MVANLKPFHPDIIAKSGGIFRQKAKAWKRACKPVHAFPDGSTASDEFWGGG
jgi:hypothetical protein